MNDITRPIYILSVFCLMIVIATGCGSSTGNSKPDLTPPQVPAGLSITAIGNGSVTLTWTGVSDSELKGYNVYWQGGASIDTLKANRYFTSNTSVTLSDLDYETTYTFAVTSMDLSGNESALSVSRSGTPYNTTPPLPPANADIVAENIEFPKITLYWSENNEPDIARYDIYRALSASTLADSTSPIASVTRNNFIDTAVNEGVAYYYCIKAVDKGGRMSAPSAIVGDAVLPRVKLVSPVNYAYSGANPILTWEAVTGVKKYTVVVTTSRIGGEIWTIEVDSSETKVVYAGKTKLIPGNTYYWKVGAISRSEVNSVSGTGAFVVKSQ